MENLNSIEKPYRIFSLKNPDVFVFQHMKDETKDALLIERKVSGPGKVNYKNMSEVKPMLKSMISVNDVYGVIGIVKLISGTFLVCISETKSVGKIAGSDIFNVLDTVFIPFGNLEGIDPLERQNIEKSYYDIRKWLGSNCFFFSYAYDITNTIQRALQISNKANKFSTINNAYFWNNFVSQFFRKNKIYDWVVPLTKGFVTGTSAKIYNQNVDIVLISRINCLRAGTRFNTRGVNDDGDVANFVETEQIVMTRDGKIASFVQIRGSVPVFWEQKFVRGKYRTSMSRGKEAAAIAFKQHFDGLFEKYGPVHVVNLLCAKEPQEKIIIDAYEDQIKTLGSSKLSYTHFDFHEQFGKSGNNFKSFGPLLLDKIQPTLQKLGFSVYSAANNQISQAQQQQGAIRTNCLDCLDRTNIVQWGIARRALTLCLRAIGVLPASTNATSDFDEISGSSTEDIHKELWSANGDAISVAYTGTGALKTGLMKTGKMTFSSLFDDSTKTMWRTYQSYFKDNTKQDIIDFFLGKQHDSDAVIDDSGLSSFSPRSEEDEDVFRWEDARSSTDTFSSTKSNNSTSNNNNNNTNDPWVLLENAVKARSGEWCKTEQTTFYVGSWNVGGASPGENLVAWLGNVNPCPCEPEFYVIGFQEVVKLTSLNVWNADESNAAVWHKQIVDVLRAQWGAEFVVLRSYQLVGLVLTVFVRAASVGAFRDVQSEISKTGFKGIAGNKGAVSIRFKYHATSFCFTCAHLTHGQTAVDSRNQDFTNILNSTTFRTANGTKKILDHDYAIVFGDLNYRINLSDMEIRKLISENKLRDLAGYDQLRKELEREDGGGVYAGFSEAPLQFPPTYKYLVGSESTYDNNEQNRRAPAWCDRVIFAARHDLKQFNYKHTPQLTSSDHKPISAVMQANITIIDKKARDAIAMQESKKLGISEEDETPTNENSVTLLSNNLINLNFSGNEDQTAKTTSNFAALFPETPKTPVLQTPEVRSPPPLPPKEINTTIPSNNNPPNLPPKPNVPIQQPEKISSPVPSLPTKPNNNLIDLENFIKPEKKVEVSSIPSGPSMTPIPTPQFKTTTAPKAALNPFNPFQLNPPPASNRTRKVPNTQQKKEKEDEENFIDFL